MEAVKRLCLNCGKELRGRIDKKFCDDYCRNNYNNHRNSDQNNLIRNINNALRKNRRILDYCIPSGEDFRKVKRELLLKEGFNFKYFTHRFQNRKGQQYLFVYDFGYLPLDDEWLLIVKQRSKESEAAVD